MQELNTFLEVHCLGLEAGGQAGSSRPSVEVLPLWDAELTRAPCCRGPPTR